MKIRHMIALLLALVLTLALGTPAFAAEFSDVPATHYAHDAIQTAAAKGITSGYADGTFKPNNPVTKGQFAVMVARAFFPEELAEYEAQGKAEGKPWHWGAIELLSHKNKNPGSIITNNGDFWNLTADKPFSRGGVADVIQGLLQFHGLKPTVEEIKAAEEKLIDVKPYHGSAYAIKVVCAFGIMSPYSDGTFRAGETTNRAQVCAVLERTIAYIDSHFQKIQFPAVVADPAAASVAIGSTYLDKIGWSIVNNEYPNGMLNNGKPITEENVLAMLADAKTNWYPGMPFSPSSENGTENAYVPYRGTSSASSLIWSQCKIGNIGYSTMEGMGGFAAMISDYIFGPSSNYPRKAEDSTQVRPGDIVIEFETASNGKKLPPSVSIALSGTVYEKEIPLVKVCYGGSDGGVFWGDDPGVLPFTRLDPYMRGPDNSIQHTTVVYTRYPA